MTDSEPTTAPHLTSVPGLHNRILVPLDPLKRVWCCANALLQLLGGGSGACTAAAGVQAPPVGMPAGRTLVYEASNRQEQPVPLPLSLGMPPTPIPLVRLTHPNPSTPTYA